MSVRRLSWVFVGVFALAAAACGDDDDSDTVEDAAVMNDGAVTDSGTEDSGAEDSGTQDAGTADSGAEDAATTDSGVASVEPVDCGSVTPDAEVEMRLIAYDPEAITIGAGEVVQWTNNEPSVISHTVTSGAPGDGDAGDLFDSGVIAQGGTFCLRFNEVGTFEYFCEIHPVQMRDATVTVE